MATDPTIRNLFGSSDDAPKSSLDVSTIIRKSRARRLPRRIGAGGVFTLAIGGLAVASVQGMGALQGTSTVAESQADSGSSAGSRSTDTGMSPMESEDSGAIKRAPAEKINLCGGALADVAPSATGLELVVNFDDASATAASVEGTVTLTNTGDAAVSGYTGAGPTITLSQGGIVLWHSNGPSVMMARDVNLAPGESLEYTASFAPVVCGVEDDSSEFGFRDDLPSVEPGEYQLSAAIDFLSDVDADLVTGPLATITLN